MSGKRIRNRKEERFLRQRFKVKKFKWYILDLRDFRKPVIVRKHLDNKMQAKLFKEKYYPGSKYDIIYWKEAKKYGIRDFESKRRKHLHHTSKYEYPEGCNTPRKKLLYRQVQRKKARQIMRQPKVTENIVWEIIDDKPIFFVKRVKRYAGNHWVFSEPVEGLKELQKIYRWPSDLRHLCNIIRVLRKYYDTGLYPVHKVAILIYKKWGARIRKHCDKYPQAIPIDKEKVKKELMKRGFENTFTSAAYVGYSHIRSINLDLAFIHPERCWHTGKEMKLYEHSVFDFADKMGIPGYTQAYQNGIEKRS